MLNRTPPTNTSNVLNSYRKRRQQRNPLIYEAVALVVIGILVIAYWLFGPSDKPLGGIFASDTPTPTMTFTPTNTSTPSQTPTITLTPTTTLTPTPSGPTTYTVVEGDTIQGIAEKFNLGDDGVLLILDSNPDIINQQNGVIFVGDSLVIPAPGTVRSTSTPIPASVPRGTKIDYKVLPGDTLAGIARRFNSKEEDIISANNITDANALAVGQVLKIPVNLVTATATLPSTSTPVTPTVEGQATATISTSVGESAACDFTENAAYVQEVQKSINDARASSGLPALKTNAQLAAAAKAHAIDLLCTNTLGHTGSDGSTPKTRVAARGYTASLVLEEYFALPPAAGGDPKGAFNWWSNDTASRTDLLNAEVTEIGVAYVASEKSLLGGYFVVVLAKP